MYASALTGIVSPPSSLDCEVRKRSLDTDGFAARFVCMCRPSTAALHSIVADNANASTSSKILNMWK